MAAICSILILVFSICGYANTICSEPGATVEAPSPYNNIASVPFELDTIDSTSGKRLDVYVIASLTDIKQGHFKIEFRETLKTADTREYTIVRFDDKNNLDSFITPYIDSPSGTYQFGNPNQFMQTLTYNFQGGGEGRYGYIVTPAAGSRGTGFCDENIGILAVFGSFPHVHYLSTIFSEVYITFDVPEGMPVYAPWTKVSNRTYRIIGDGSAEHYDVASWGNFSSIELRQYGEHNEHKLYMLEYGTDATKNFEFTGFVYDYFMKAFQDNIEFLPSINQAIVLPLITLPDYSYAYSPLAEGYGGSYSPNIVGDNLLAKIDNNGGHAQCDQGMTFFNFVTNGMELTVAPVHHSAHHSLRYFLQNSQTVDDWWSVEGIAVYYQFDMLRRKGIISETMMKKEFAAHLAYHQANISGTSNDHVLKNFEYSSDNCANFRIPYIKGALIFYTLNEIIKESTNGKSELIDMFTILYRMFKEGSRNEYSTFITALNSLTGRDFQEFFEKYVYGTDPLPLKISGDDILLTYMPPGHPLPNIKANNQDGPITVSFGSPVTLNVKLYPGNNINQNADWWVAESPPSGTFNYYNLSRGSMVPGLLPTHQGPLFKLGTTNLLNSSDLTVGSHTFYFGVDLIMNGSLDMDSIYYDSVNVIVQ